MTLDIVTLMAASCLVAALAALVLAGAWILMRDRALLWWAGSSAVLSIAILVLICGVVVVAPPIVALGGTVAAFSPALLWAGARDFAQRPIPVAALVGGLAFIVIVTALEPFDPAHLSTRLAGFLVWIAYLTAASVEIWFSGKEPLRARWPLIFLFALHGSTFVGGVIEGLAGHLSLLGVPLTITSWFGAIHLETILYSMGTTVFMVVLCKERSELHLRTAAGFDSLTGALARGAFSAQAEWLFARARKDGTALTVILADLDRFKTINDTFGHRVGDRVLTIFADCARAGLRPTDLFGRYGGEEFVFLLPGASLEEASLVAERIRLGFAAACAETDGGIAATLSAGIAEMGSEGDIGSLLDEADQALYRAKNLGRNRIERAEPPDTRAVLEIAWPSRVAAG